MKPFDAALKGVERDRLHHSVDHLQPRRRVHSGAADERRGRPRVPRIRGDDHGGDPGLRLRLADADADAVRAHSLGAQAWRGGGLVLARSPTCSSIRWRGFYRVTLDMVLRARFLMLLVTFGTGWLALSLYANVPKGFFPEEDTGFLRGITEAQSDTSFTEMSRRQQIVVSILQKDPAVESVTSAVGFGGATNKGFLFLKLKPKARARAGVQGDGAAARRDLGHPRHPHADAAGAEPRIHRRPHRRAPNTNTRCNRATRTRCSRNAPIMEREIGKLPGLRDVNSDLQITNPQTKRRHRPREGGRLRRQRRRRCASRSTAPSAAKQISTIFTPADDYQVILEASDKFQNDPAALGRLRVATPSGALVPLDEVATLKRSVGPLQINRQSQQPAVTISFNLAPDTSLGQAIEEIRALERTHQPARRHHHQFRRQRAVVPAGAGRTGRAAARRGADDLHPARRALRELHPPDHDSLRPAVGRHRRAARAAMAAHGPVA